MHIRVDVQPGIPGLSAGSAGSRMSMAGLKCSFTAFHQDVKTRSISHCTVSKHIWLDKTAFTKSDLIGVYCLLSLASGFPGFPETFSQLCLKCCQNLNPGSCMHILALSEGPILVALGMLSQIILSIAVPESFCKKVVQLTCQMSKSGHTARRVCFVIPLAPWGLPSGGRCRTGKRV